MPFPDGRLMVWCKPQNMTSPRSISKKYKIHPRKRLGQSFLRDGNVVRKIVVSAGLEPVDSVIEIGAGMGVMTAEIAALVKNVLAVEVDPNLILVLNDVLKNTQNVRIVHKDVLTYDLSQAARELDVDKIKILGNIPYSISSPILFHLLDYRRIISRAVLMVQKEVAERICAGVGTKSYGIPSVLTAVYAKATMALTVPAGCFYPEPKVTSAVIVLDFRSEPLCFIADEPFFQQIVRLAFSSRRKTLMNNLRHSRDVMCSEECLQRILESLGIDLRIRGEALSPEQFITLSNAIFQERNSGNSNSPSNFSKMRKE
ncbi:MAG: Ribosomal RNA small subunit methyltransferase A [Syntrophus sp. SKADARSKE-3]|nr:Ribosomal RNA small subunit methyltransferase A [Syntrophus sp. SKADARSKE-3]